MIAKRGSCKIIIRDLHQNGLSLSTIFRSLVDSERWQSRACDLCRYGAPHRYRMALHGHHGLVNGLARLCTPLAGCGHNRRGRKPPEASDVVGALAALSGALAALLESVVVGSTSLAERGD